MDLHLTIGIAIILASIKWANWRKWQLYYPTILYITVSNLLYKFFALNDFHLWKLSSNDFFFQSHFGIFLWHILLINPLFTLMYLSKFPEGQLRKKMFYILAWLASFMTMEFILLTSGHINYFHGWNFKWTILFDLVMFLMLRLHFKKPLWAIILSIFNTLFYLVVFGYIG